MMTRILFAAPIALSLALGAQVASAQATPAEIEAMRSDQLARFVTYMNDAILPNGLVRDALTTSPSTPPFHPATPDAAGFALLGLCAADHLGLMPDAEAKAQLILNTYAGFTPGVTPQRSANGHWIHFLNINTGLYQPGWDAAYSPIGSALLVTGAQFAANHFIDNPTIAALAQNLSDTTNFNDAIHPALDGRIWLSVGPSGTGDPSFGAVSPWNEYMLVVRLALRETPNNRAIAVANSWVNPNTAPTRSYAGVPLLTDNPASYAPAFWVQQQYYFNSDFSTNPAFVAFFNNHAQADKLYCTTALGQAYRYGLTAGVNPSGYRADRIADHESVFSPEAVGGFGDLETLVQWFADQPPASDPRYRYGMVRTSSALPSWIPPDHALVDHMFLMFGLVESIDPLFFKQRQPGQADNDADGIADPFDNCNLFNPSQADCNANGVGDACDIANGTEQDVDLNGVPDSCQACSLADITTEGQSEGAPDGIISLSDFSAYLARWSNDDPRADITADGDCDPLTAGDGVTLSDFSCYLALWSAGCP